MEILSKVFRFFLIYVVGLLLLITLIVLFIDIIKGLKKRSGYKKVVKNEQDRIIEDKQKLDKMINEYLNSSFLNEILHKIHSLSNGKKLLSLNISYNFIEYELFDCIRDNKLITNEGKILFETLGYSHFNLLEELNGFAIALKTKLGDDYDTFYQSREQTRHDPNLYYTYNNQPDVRAIVYYKYDNFKPKQKPTH